MDAAEKVMIACLLLSEGGEDEAVREFIAAVESGMELGERDSLEMHRALMARMEGQLPAGPAGTVIRLMKAKREHDEVCRKFGMAASGLSKALSILQQPVSGDLAAKILVTRAMAALGAAKRGIAG